MDKLAATAKMMAALDETGDSKHVYRMLNKASVKIENALSQKFQCEGKVNPEDFVNLEISKDLRGRTRVGSNCQIKMKPTLFATLSLVCDSCVETDCGEYDNEAVLVLDFHFCWIHHDAGTNGCDAMQFALHESGRVSVL